MIFITVSTGHFDPLIRACALLHSEHRFVAQIGSGTYVPPFEHFRTGTPDQIESWIQKSTLVISHGGTGMLSMIYRLKKPSIVVPKQMRYGESNDSQVELAQRWSEEGMSLLCMDVNRIGEAIQKAQHWDFRFPTYPSLGHHLDGVL